MIIVCLAEEYFRLSLLFVTRLNDRKLGMARYSIAEAAKKRKANNQQNKRCRTESSSVRQRFFNFSTGQLSMSSKAASPFFASALASPCLTKHIVTKLSATNSAAYGNSTR